MLRLKVERRIKARLPTLRGFSRAMWADVGNIVIGGVLENIMKQQTVDGGRLKVNAPSTRERKRQGGRPLLSLVDLEHRLVRAGGASYDLGYLPGGAGVVVRAATDEVARLMRWVQEAGYVRWFGISKTTRAAIRERFRQELRRLIAAK